MALNFEDKNTRRRIYKRALRDLRSHVRADGNLHKQFYLCHYFEDNIKRKYYNLNDAENDLPEIFELSTENGAFWENCSHTPASFDNKVRETALIFAIEMTKN